MLNGGKAYGLKVMKLVLLAPKVGLQPLVGWFIAKLTRVNYLL